MKVYSIVYGSVLNPDRIALCTLVADSSEIAYAQSLESVNRTFGDLLWKPRMSNYLDLKPEGKRELPSIASTIGETHDKNWIMKTIIESKDEKLLTAVRSYLSENEVKLIEEKIL